MKSRQTFAHSRFQLLAASHVMWLGLVCALAAWWGRFLMKQAGLIRELEILSGKTVEEAQAHWTRVHEMVYWESSVFFALIFLSAAFIFWVYWRDMKRARSVQAFFASVTHELRTPLTSIRLQAETIAENFSQSSPERTLVDRLMEDTTRLEAQVERTLELARVEGGGPVFVQSVQLKPWIERMVQTWRDAYGSRLSIDTSGIEDVTIEADPTCLQTILKNLLENTLRHSKKQIVSAKLSTQSSEAFVQLLYQDDGAGFDGNWRKLGELFHRGSSSQGTGVGLYLIQTLMGKMGGKTDFTQAPGNGFRVLLGFVREASHGG